ncbi:MAG: preprotein translocase subunit SecE [Bacteroidota bacterium]
MATQTQTEKAPGGKIGGYILEVRKEMRKVNWPKRQELLSNTTLTLVASFIIALFIFGADQVISWVLARVYGA